MSLKIKSNQLNQSNQLNILFGALLHPRTLNQIHHNLSTMKQRPGCPFSEPFAREVLAFIERIIAQRDSGIEDLKMAQEPAMKRVWENTEDDIWNEL
jgi:hypothetical protein